MRRAGLGTLDPGSQTGWLVGGLEPEVSVRQWGRAALPGTSGVRVCVPARVSVRGCGVWREIDRRAIGDGWMDSGSAAGWLAG